MKLIPDTETLIAHCLGCDQEWTITHLPVLEPMFVDALHRKATEACPKCGTFRLRMVLGGPRDATLIKVAALVDEANANGRITKEILVDSLMAILSHHGLPLRS